MMCKRIVICLLAALMLLTFGGCGSRHPDVYYNDIQVQWLDEAYEADTIEFDNEWLQKRSLAAAEGQDLTTIEGLTAYLDSILPTIERYFAREEELTNIWHYDNGIWRIRFDYQPESMAGRGSIFHRQCITYQRQTVKL